MGTDTIVQELNRLYEFEMDKYITECEHWKKMGYKIFRNSKGKHKVVEPPKVDHKYDIHGRPDVSKMFAGTPFEDIFGAFN